jgi:hypothetical protein
VGSQYTEARGFVTLLSRLQAASGQQGLDLGTLKTLRAQVEAGTCQRALCVILPCSHLGLDADRAEMVLVGAGLQIVLV